MYSLRCWWVGLCWFRYRTVGIVWTVRRRALVVIQVHYFFNTHLPTLNHQLRNDLNRNRDVHDALLRSVDFVPGTQVHVIDSPVMNINPAQQIMRFLVDGITVFTVERADFTGEYLVGLESDIPHAFYVGPDDIMTISLLQTAYPELQGPRYSPYDVPEDKISGL